MEQRRSQQSMEQADLPLAQDVLCERCGLPLKRALGGEAVSKGSLLGSLHPRGSSKEGFEGSPESWGVLCEKFSVNLSGRSISILVYFKPYDENWNMYTTVNAETNTVINKELCPV